MNEPDKNVLAGMYVSRYKKIPPSKRQEILDMLGILGPRDEETGKHTVIPAPTNPDAKQQTLGQVHGEFKTHLTRGTEDMKTPLKDRSSLPPGLRNLPGQEKK